MKSIIIFYTAIVIDIFTLLVMVNNAVMMSVPMKPVNGYDLSPSAGLTSFGKIMNWVFPAGLLAVILIGYWLRKSGKLMAANVLLAIPAVPIGIALIICGGLAVLFILFGK